MTKYKYSSEQLRAAVAASFSYANVLRELGIPQAGGSQSYVKKRILKEEIDTSHFTGMAWNKGKSYTPRRTAEEVLVLRDPHEPKTKTAILRRALLERGRPQVCEACGTGNEYNGLPLTLEIDHRNGVGWDHREENLRFLCPNCHSQQDTNTPWKNKV